MLCGSAAEDFLPRASRPERDVTSRPNWTICPRAHQVRRQAQTDRAPDKNVCGKANPVGQPVAGGNSSASILHNDFSSRLNALRATVISSRLNTDSRRLAISVCNGAMRDRPSGRV